MSSAILQTATRYLVPLMGLYSLFLLWEGHHSPGGGFIGGLVAAAAIALCALAFDAQKAAQVLPAAPHRLIGVGLLCMAGSGIWGTLFGKPFLTGMWLTIESPFHLSLGTPLLFDLGVYLLVIGSVLMILFTLADVD